MAQTPREGGMPPEFDDAELTSLSFVDDQFGWVAGDRGVLLHTRDGGATWEWQPTNVDCRLESVHFLDRQRGWAAGGWFAPHTHNSRGVILKTDDGGGTWIADRGMILPAVHRLVFFDAANGFTLTEPSAMFPSGLLTTSDGGRSWSPVASSGTCHWLACDMVDPFTGAAAGRAGAMASVRRRVLEPSRTPPVGARNLRALSIAVGQGISPTDTVAWLVGDGGLIFTSQDLGASWQTPAAPPLGLAAEQFDLLAVEAHGRSCWIGGAPGSMVLVTHDSGLTWHANATGQNAPLRDIVFVDQDRGFACGSLGTILRTLDGGRTWRRARGTDRVTMLGVFFGSRDVPFEVVSKVAGDEGYLTAVVALAREDFAPCRATASSCEGRLHQACVAAGGSLAQTLWAFPSHDRGERLPAEEIARRWSQNQDDAVIDRLLANLVCRLRYWRPDVVLTHGDSSGIDGASDLAHQVVLQAVTQAGDATRYPEQLSELGLRPLETPNVFGVTASGDFGAFSLSASEIGASLGRSFAEQALAARGLVSSDFEPPRETIAFRTYLQGRGEAAPRDLTSGLVARRGSEARRREGPSFASQLDALELAAKKQRNLRSIVTRGATLGRDPAVYLGQLGEMTSGMSRDAAASLLFQTAQELAESGQWELAAETFDQVAREYPDQPLAAAALAWLIRSTASGEIAWQVARRQVRVDVGGETPPQALGQVIATAPEIEPGLVEAPTSPLLNSAARRWKVAVALAERLERIDPTLACEPLARFPLAALERAAGETQDASRQFGVLAQAAHYGEPFAIAAAGENWLLNRAGQAPKPVLSATAMSAKPRLDGVLDEPEWGEAASASLRSAVVDDAAWPARVMVRHDADFIYLAIECDKAAGVTYRSSDAIRARDAEMRDRDRVDLYFDIDRDAATYYRLTVDHRGWTGESLAGSTAWNPEWFVAAKDEPRTWTIEAAIAWKELAPAPPTRHDAWMFGAQRTVPGVGFQAMSAPASTEVLPEGFGYLTFD